MKRLGLLTLLWIALPLVAQAQGIYKCVAAGEVAYQSMPCPAGQFETVIPWASPSPRQEISSAQPYPANEWPQASDPSPAVEGSKSRSWVPWKQQTLRLGMSDDEVLNLPGWGRPSRITRTKANRVWREQWDYAVPGGETRLLNFTNGKLSAVEMQPADAPDQLTRLTLQ
jgi:hypothetical protein